MNSPSSTFTVIHDATQTHPAKVERSTLFQKFFDYWKDKSDTEVVADIQDRLYSTSKRSIVIRLAVERYRQHCQKGTKPDLDLYCRKFKPLGKALCSSIYREIEIAQYFDAHPNLLEADESLPWPEIDDQVGGFLIEEELGRGGMGRVYLCRELNLRGRQVVAKLSFRKTDEAKTLANLAHANIIPIHSFLQPTPEGLAGIIMPFLGRSTLEELVEIAFQYGPPTTAQVIWEAANCWSLPDEQRARPMLESPRNWNGNYVAAVLDIGIQLADALAFAHEKEVIHGDIKPSNILLTPAGTPFIIDFNLSHDAELNVQLRGGTLPYMSPEQILALTRDEHDEPVIYDQRTDVYALGALLYQMLCGNVPYETGRHGFLGKESARELVASRKGVPRAAESRNAQVSRELSAIVAKALAFSPDDRFTSMAEMQSALVHEQHHQLACELRKMAQRRWSIVRYSLLAVILAILTAYSAFQALRPPEFQRLAKQAVAVAKQGHLQHAIELLDQSLMRNANYVAARYVRAQILIAQGNHRDVTSDAATMADAQHHPALRALVAWCWAGQKRFPAAARAYQESIDQGLNTAAAHNNLGYSYLCSSNYEFPNDKERLQAAIRSFDKAIDINPSYEPARINRVDAVLQWHQLGKSPPEMQSHSDEAGDKNGMQAVRGDIEWLLKRHPLEPIFYEWAIDIYLEIPGGIDRCRSVIAEAEAQRIAFARRVIDRWSNHAAANLAADFQQYLEQARQSPPRPDVDLKLPRTTDPRFDLSRSLTTLTNLKL